jgi:hypothetical protein
MACGYCSITYIKQRITLFATEAKIQILADFISLIIENT